MVLATRGGQLLLPQGICCCLLLLLSLLFVALAFMGCSSFFPLVMNQAVAAEAISAVRDCTTQIQGRLGLCTALARLSSTLVQT